MHNSTEDRRKESRINIRFSAMLSWTDTTGQEITETTHTFSISNSGAGLVTKQPIPIGQKVKVTMDVGGHSGASWGVIKWSLPADDLFVIGVSFRN
jgi:hypothetical protein